MRVLFLTPAFPPFPGGGERYVSSLAGELVRRGHGVTTVTSSAQTEPELWQGTVNQQIVTEKNDGIRIIRCPLRPFPGGRPALLAWRKAMVLFSMLPGNQTAILLKMAKLIPPIRLLESAVESLLDNFDLIHGFNLSWEHTLVVGWRYARCRNLPFIVTPFTHLGTGEDRVARNSTMDHQLELIRDADRVLTLTNLEKKGLIELGIPLAKLDVIGGGLDPFPPPSKTGDLLARLGIQEPFVLFLGRASYDKGAIHAVQAILALREQGSCASLVQVGQTSPEFDRFLSQLDDEEREGIRPLGILNDSDKHVLLEASSLLILPSRTDSFGIVLLEAWAHGKPVIGAHAGGIPGVVDDGKNGLLVTFGDVPGLTKAINQLLTDFKLNQKMGYAGRNKVKTNYTWEKVSDRTLKNYLASLRDLPKKE